MQGTTNIEMRDAALASLYFLLSTLITWWFIVSGKGLYRNMDKMLLSCSIAGGKWAVQIGAAVVWLKKERWTFLRKIGATCLVGSLILLPFCFEYVRHLLGERGFLISLVVCVLTMMVLYYYSVRSSGLPIRWFAGWLVCLAIAITLQLTVVFHVAG